MPEVTPYPYVFPLHPSPLPTHQTFRTQVKLVAGLAAQGGSSCDGARDKCVRASCGLGKGAAGKHHDHGKLVFVQESGWAFV